MNSQREANRNSRRETRKNMQKRANPLSKVTMAMLPALTIGVIIKIIATLQDNIIISNPAKITYYPPPKIGCRGEISAVLAPELVLIFEFAANQLMCQLTQIKTKAKPTENRNLHSKMADGKKIKKIKKELLLLEIDLSNLESKSNYEKTESGRIQEFFESISTNALGNGGFDVKKEDVIRARRVHVWPDSFPHGPIVIKFRNEVIIKKAKNVLKMKAGRFGTVFGTILCDISCQSSAGNR